MKINVCSRVVATDVSSSKPAGGCMGVYFVNVANVFVE
jgi:hypothetical protein